MKTNKHLTILFQKYLNNTFTKGELEELLSYFNQDVDSDELTGLIATELASNNDTADQQELIDSISANLDKKLFASPPPKNKSFSLFWAFPIAAALLIAIGFAYYYIEVYNYQKGNSDLAGNFKSVEPGKIAATLILSDGKRILLSQKGDGELASQSGVKITKTNEGNLIYEVLPSTGATSGANATYNTLQTENGETYSVRLPDRTLVTLNAGSSLRYPVNFGKLESRMVSLTGEAYFEVEKDSKHPFIVQTQKQQVIVIGTHFNINSYSDESSTVTTLVEGSVKVKSLLAANISTILKPSQQAINRNSTIEVKPADIASTTAWKNGEFLFDNEPLESVMRQISRWYNVDIIYTDAFPKNLTIGGMVSRSVPLPLVLETIEQTRKIKFKTQGRKIYVSQ